MSQDIEVKVRATLDEADRVVFDSIWKREPDKRWRTGAIDVPKGNTDHDIHFTLDDLTDLDLQFYPDADSPKAADQPFWVDATSCPKGGSGTDYGQLYDKKVASKAKLKLRNKNDTACLLHYALRFTGKPGKQAEDPAKACPPYEYDPDLRNGGR